MKLFYQCHLTILIFLFTEPIQAQSLKLKTRWADPSRSIRYGMSLSADGKILAMGSSKNTIKLWNLTTGKLQATLTGHKSAPGQLHFSSDGSKLASVDETTVRVWNLKTGKVLQQMSGWSALTLSPNGKMIATPSDPPNYTVKIYNAQTGKLSLTISGHKNGATETLCFSPDGKTLATGSADKTVRLWNAATGQLQRTLKGHRWFVNDVEFSPSGGKLASAASDGTVKLWDVKSGKLEKTLIHTTRNVVVCSVSFSPDGKLLASVTEGRTVKLWDSKTGRHLATVRPQGLSSGWVFFSPDGQLLITAGSRGRVVIWSIEGLKQQKSG